MEKYVIRGGKPLVGDVNIGGAKNAAVAIPPATILAGGKCLIENLPCISDVMASLQILSELGASIRMVSRSTYEIDTSHLDSTEVSNELSRQMRASYYFLGALLGRFGSGQVAMPGGCNLGPRPIDQHLKAFTAFGAEDSVEYGQIHVRSEHLVGGHVFFDTVSVGATMNAMLAAVLAEGTTILENVAREPHIVDLANFLNMMGADVHGAGTDVIKIHGVKEMHGCNYSIIPDQIEAGSYMVAARGQHPSGICGYFQGCVQPERGRRRCAGLRHQPDHHLGLQARCLLQRSRSRLCRHGQLRFQRQGAGASGHVGRV